MILGLNRVQRCRKQSDQNQASEQVRTRHANQTFSKLSTSRILETATMKSSVADKLKQETTTDRGRTQSAQVAIGV